MALKLFDLHCDTLTECFHSGKSLLENDLHLDIRRGLGFERWVQCFAVWIPDEVRGDEAVSLFEGATDLLEREAARCPALRLIRSSADLDALRPGECGAMLTVESGAAAAGSLERLSAMARRGDVWRHAEHFLALGGENVLAMGSDFDGTDLPEDLRGVGDMEALCEDFLRHGCPEDVVRRIFFENAYNFFHSL